MDKRGAILMSEKERRTLVVMERVKRNEITMAGATRLLGISYRQSWRRMRRYEAEGAQGLAIISNLFSNLEPSGPSENGCFDVHILFPPEFPPINVLEI